MKKIKMAVLAIACLALAVGAFASSIQQSIEQIIKAGLTATYTSSGLTTTDTYLVSNDGNVFLHFKKTGAGACTVTIATPNTVQGLSIADQTISIPATTGDKFVGPFSATLFNDAAGNVSFTLSDTVGLSFAVLRL